MMSSAVEPLSPERLQQLLAAIPADFQAIRGEIAKRVFGQEQLIEDLLLALLCRSHCLLTGVPGLAKTLLIKTLSEVTALDFTRVQFTPDMMPGDITGSEILEENADGKRRFEFIKGPVFTQLLLADEINRTSPKTQSALLEAMEERQISMNGRVWPLPDPFFVLATQNPIEQEGTYQLPEAQQDRFMFSLFIDYPDSAAEKRIMLETTRDELVALNRVVTAAQIRDYQRAVRELPVPDSVADYALRLVRSTRPAEPEASEAVRKYIRWGAGPRAGQYLILAGKAYAALDGRRNVSRMDIVRAAPPVLRHRLLLNFRAQADEVTADTLISGLLK